MNRASYHLKRYVAAGLVLIHLVISLLHGIAHQLAMVTLTTFGYAYVLIIITVAPLAAAALLFTRQRKFGALLLALSMLGSFLFGFWYHFLSSTGDNIAQVHGSWRAAFLWTAIALAAVELAGTFAGLSVYRAMRSTRN